LRAIRRGVVDPSIAKHNSRIVKTTGDGLLAELQSVINALRCATERGTRFLPMARSPGASISITAMSWSRNGDIFGDGVNVAARLEGLAEPGGICVSARIWEEAIGKVDLIFDD
jgi:adenylate cyclase